LTLDELLGFLRTARSSVELRMWPLMFDGDKASTDMTDDDVARAVAVVQHAIETTGMRAHVAVATSDDRLYRGMLLYESKCADIGVRLVRDFRHRLLNHGPKIDAVIAGWMSQPNALALEVRSEELLVTGRYWMVTSVRPPCTSTSLCSRLPPE
jgi:hypothetical protein